MVYQYSPSAGTWREWATIVPVEAAVISSACRRRSAVWVSSLQSNMGPFGTNTGLGLLYEMPEGIDGDWQEDTRRAGDRRARHDQRRTMYVTAQVSSAEDWRRPVTTH